MRPQNASGRASVVSAASSVGRSSGSTIGASASGGITSSSNLIYLNNQEAIPLENLLPAVPTRFSNLPAALCALLDALHAADSSAASVAEQSSAAQAGTSTPVRTIRFSLPGGQHSPRSARVGGEDRSLPASAIPVRVRQLTEDGIDQSSDLKPSSASTAVVYVLNQVAVPNTTVPVYCHNN